LHNSRDLLRDLLWGGQSWRSRRSRRQDPLESYINNTDGSSRRNGSPERRSQALCISVRRSTRLCGRRPDLPQSSRTGRTYLPRAERPCLPAVQHQGVIGLTRTVRASFQYSTVRHRGAAIGVAEMLLVQRIRASGQVGALLAASLAASGDDGRLR
jgi:hypothetical protein